MFPPTYLLVGANRGIAQASGSGQLVTITRLRKKKEDLMLYIVHELTHFQQAKSIGFQSYVSLYQNPDFLGFCVREGNAEFITSQVMGDISQRKSLAYFEDHMEELNEKFEADLESGSSEDWLWGKRGKERIFPQLLGYIMGYKIAESYFVKHSDKTKAIEEILNVTDYKKFYDLSGYNK